MMSAHPFRQVTEFHGAAPRARALITRALEERLGPVELEFDFHREWNGGWRCQVDVTGRGSLVFVLLESPEGAMFALPHPLPARWRDARGFAAEDESRWSFDDEGQVVRLSAAPPAEG